MEVCATLLQVFLFSILLTDSLTYYTVKSISYVCSIICPFFDMKFFFQMEVFTALHWGGAQLHLRGNMGKHMVSYNVACKQNLKFKAAR